ncbi:hypothetical protein [Pseudoblastomonas halimionae]|uniref:hypothetical protein n=1 Tax=Alteriqipengyuania halimionae TaxID=1926630 RepID=UPI001F4641EF|nr:hypothetical protein [Alteriqipengyuania halimionae]
MTKRTGLFALLIGALLVQGCASVPDGEDPVARPERPASLQNYIFAGGDTAESHRDLLARDDIGGIQIVYSWRKLEPREGEYDFSAIERDLALADAADKALWVQVQDRFFRPQDRLVPDYILTEPRYDGGLIRQVDNPGEGVPTEQGWATKQWNPAVRARFQALLSALAERFDGKIEGINLPETSVDPIGGVEAFDCDAYVDAEIANAAHASAAFRRSHVVQYVNFWPCEWNDDRGYMTRIFAAAFEHGFGIGGPDIVPNKRAQVKNSYPFLHRNHERLPIVAMAVQEPTLTYRDPATGTAFDPETIAAYARDYLGVDIIFWTAEAPWLSEAEAGDNAPNP